MLARRRPWRMLTITTMPPERPVEPAVIDEILPPSGKGGAQESTPPTGPAQGKPLESELVRYLARWLDDFMRIPGTEVKVGLDPILSLIPVVGGTVATGGAVVILLEAVRCGISFPVLIRMSANVLINGLFDAIPVAGPVASAFFKSNSRNLELLRQWQSGQKEAVEKSTLRAFLVAGGVLAVLVTLWLALWAVFVGMVVGFWRWLFGR